MRQTAAFCFLGLSLFLSLCACAPTPYYAGTRLEQAPVGEIDRSDMVIALDYAIQAGRVPRFEMTTPQGRYVIHPPEQTAPVIDMLPLPVLVAAYNVLYRKKTQGIEWDLLIKTEHGERVPVTAYLEPDGRLSVVQGAPLPPPAVAPPPTAEELRARYGIGELKGGDVAWTDEQRRTLDAALALVPEEERAIISGVPFMRYHRLDGEDEKKGVWTTAARYRREGGVVEIHLFDHLFELDDMLFCGDVQSPHPASAQSIVHELGHALVAAARVRAIRDYNQSVNRYNAGLAALRALPASSSETPALVALLKKEQATFEVQEARLKRARGSSAVLDAYKDVRGWRKGPTPYGRTELEESFAESYSLHHVDPAALRRVYPEVADWFAAGKHLEAMRSEQ